MSALPKAFLAAVARDFPGDFLSLDAAERAEYGRDWTRIFPVDASGVCFPRSTDEVARLLQLCGAHRVAVVPSGGRTGLAAGAVATRGELVVSLSRLRRMDPVDLLGGTVRVQAGVVTEALHRHVSEHGLQWPVDFASKGSSEIGGNISTNAGGVRVIRYGHTRQWVLGLQVVLASGEVLELGGALEKNNTGLDLRQLFIGSEGTLGIITEATLKLCGRPARSDVMLFAVRDLPSVLSVFRDVRRAGFTLGAFEFFTDRCLRRVERHRKLVSPLETPSSHYVLVELEGTDASALELWVGGLYERGLVLDGTLAQTPSQATELWSFREAISESLAATGFPYKNDIALPIAALEAFCAELDALLGREYPDFELCLFGHIGDGNLHVNVMKPEGLDKETFLSRTQAADKDVFALVQKHRGSISAEHGIGLVKKAYLSYSRTPGEIALMRAVKHTLDPQGTLNPGKIFD